MNWQQRPNQEVGIEWVMTQHYLGWQSRYLGGGAKAPRPASGSIHSIPSRYGNEQIHWQAFRLGLQQWLGTEL